MLKVNGTEIENVKFNGVDLDNIIVNGITVFEKTASQENTITMRTLHNHIYLFVRTKDDSPCEVWNDGNKIGVLNSSQLYHIYVTNKNEDVLVKGKGITVLSCSRSYLCKLNIQGLMDLQELDCSYNSLRELSLQGLKSLTRVFCSYNILKELNLQDTKALRLLNCTHNFLTELTLNGLRYFHSLSCSYNRLTRLNIQDTPALFSIKCMFNNLSQQAIECVLRALPDSYPDKEAVLFYKKFPDMYPDENTSLPEEKNYQFDYPYPKSIKQALDIVSLRRWKILFEYKKGKSYV